MKFSMFFAFVIVVGLYSYNISEAREPVCSKFAYEEQLLEKMIRTEIKVETIVNDFKKIEDNVVIKLRDIIQTVVNFTDKFEDMRENMTDELIHRGDEIKKKEESFTKLFEEIRKNLTSDIEAQRNALVKFRGNLERPQIAFHAYHVKDVDLDNADEILIFEKTFINEGTGYDTSTGIFTAPADRLYQFSVHTCANIAKFVFIGIVLEGNVIAADSNYDKDYYTCSTIGAVVRVKSGERVWVKSTLSSSNSQLVQDSLRMNIFSGLFINN